MVSLKNIYYCSFLKNCINDGVLKYLPYYDSLLYNFVFVINVFDWRSILGEKHLCIIYKLHEITEAIDSNQKKDASKKHTHQKCAFQISNNLYKSKIDFKKRTKLWTTNFFFV